MPIFNEYQNDPGYYIRAWTPNTGNINYKIREEGYPIVEDYDLSHSDEISWDTIRSLKTMGLIYTEASGTIANDEFEPDPEQVDETTLSTEEAEELLEVILEHRDLTSDEIDKIFSILGIDSTSNEFKELETDLTEKVESLIETGIFPGSKTLRTSKPERILVAVTTEDLRETTENGLMGVVIAFMSDLPDSDKFPIVKHSIFVCQEHGIESWNVQLERVKTWEKKGEVTRQKGILTPSVADLIEQSGIDPGDPTDTPAPELMDFQ
jgi:hypothetical protein